MKLKVQKILEFLVCLFPLCFQIANITGKTIVIYIVYIVLVVSYFMSEKNRVYSKNLLAMIGSLCLANLLIPMLSGNFQLQSFFYFCYMFLFLLSTYIAGNIFNNTDNTHRLLTYLWFFSIVPILYQTFTHSSQYSKSAFMTVFNGIRQGRSYFGYSHPNFVGMFLVVAFFLTMVQLFYAKGFKHKSFYLLFGIWLLITVCMTGSRSSLYCCVLFGILEFVNWLTSRNKKLKKYLYPLMVVFVLIIIIGTIGESLLENSSGRVDLLYRNFDILVEKGNLMLGTGGLSVSSRKEGISHSDNWYMTAIINTGIMGFLVTLSMVFHTVAKLFIGEKDRFTYLTSSMTIVLFVYSFAENTLFVPGVEISWITWVFIMSCTISNKSSIERKQYE